MSNAEEAPATASQSCVMSGTASVLALANIIQPFSGDGNGTSVKDFFEILEQVAEMGGWTHAQKLGMAKCRMVGAAYEFAWKDMHAKTAKSYSEFKRIALERFDNAPRSVRLRNFLDARQKPHEDVQTYASRIQALAYDAFDCSREENGEQQAQSYLEEQLTAQFVGGLRDPVRRFVLSKNPTKFTQAVEEAVREERNEALTTGSIEKVRAVTEMTLPNREIEKLTERLTRLEELLTQTAPEQIGVSNGNRRARGRGQGRWQTSNVRCYSCSNVGHIARYCPFTNGQMQVPANETIPKEPRQPVDTTREPKNL